MKKNRDKSGLTGKGSVGCCGAFCGTCVVIKDGICAGCKTGYREGKRDLAKAKCKMKVCCIGKNLESCADCGDFNSCKTLAEFYGKKGYKYGKYREALVFIRNNGYEEFISIAGKWTKAYGKYPSSRR